jgi:amino acid adenylation domain-containing protein/non-ribosomal peptide synthase protein (TIGR01720 family)
VSKFVSSHLKEWGKLESTPVYLPLYGEPPFPRLGRWDSGLVTIVNPCAVKGISIFLEVARRMPDVAFGAVPTWGTSDEERRALERTPNVRVLQASRDFDRILEQTRVLLVPSLWREAFGMVVVEAMLRGIPVLTSDAGGLPEAGLGVATVLPVRTIDRYGDELDASYLPVPIVPEQDAAPWCEALRGLLADGAIYERRAQEAWDASHRFLAGLSIEPLEKVLAELPTAPRRNVPAPEPAAEDAGPGKRLTKEQQALLMLRMRKKAAAEAARTGESLSIPRAPRDKPLPLSFAQQRLWLLDQIEPGSTVYNMIGALRIRGPLRPEVMQKVLTEVVRRHEVLRSVFEVVGGEPAQVVLPARPFELPVTALPAGEDPEAAIRAEASAEMTPFDLTRGPLLRARLLRLSPDDHVLTWSAHHICADGWSFSVLSREIAVLYDAYARGEGSPLPEPKIQYADFAVWQRERLAGKFLEALLGYWRAKLAGAPPELTLPTDRPRLPEMSHRGKVHRFALPRETGAGVRELGRSEDATPFMVLVAAYALLLSRYARQRDIVIGTPIANRKHAETHDLIGFFVNMLALRVDVGAATTFRELVRQVARTALDAFEHQDLPFERLVQELHPERHLSRTPIFQVTFALQNVPSGAEKLRELEITGVDPDPGQAKFDISVFMHESAGGALSAELQYSLDLFDPSTIERLSRQLTALTAAAVARPDAPLAALSMMSDDERRLVTVDWNATRAPFDENATLTSLITEQTRARPSAPAVRFGGDSLTYQELDERASRIGRRLRAAGIGPDACVGVCAEPSMEVVVGMLAALRAGGAYLPLDPAHPQARLRAMIASAGAAVVLCPRALIDRFRDLGARVIVTDDPEHASGSAELSEPDTKPQNVAYTIYTSGSTGAPKGVMCTHRNAINLLADFQSRKPLGPEDCASVWTSFGFDVSVYEVFSALTRGAVVDVVPAETRADSVAFIDWLYARRITSAYVPPFALEELAREIERRGPSALRRLLVGVEPIPEPLLARIASSSPGLCVINGYGPTETTVCCTLYDVPAREAPARRTPIGRPVKNDTILLLDEAMQPVPPGVPGELYVGGVGVARGYLGRPDLTAERFVPDPFSTSPGGRLYRTGDVARYLPSGDIEFLGRSDHQIKLRGFRVELGEIESALREHPDVHEAVVVVREEPGGSKRLVAYATPSRDEGRDRGDAGALVENWSIVYDEIYSTLPKDAGATFQIHGWKSSYTGQDIPASEMREWVERTVERIASLGARSILEVGCGTGLLLFRLAPGCERYVGVDFSKDALAHVRSNLDRPELRGCKIELLHGEADRAAALVEGEVDCVVINSVAQYFPNASYLLDVLRSVRARVRSGGTIFLGDLRNLALLDAFGADVELARGSGASAAELAARARLRVVEETELLVDPRFFERVPALVPGVSRAEVLVKRGAYDNELSRYRYDVVMRVGEAGPREDVAEARWSDVGSLAAFEERMRAWKGEALVVRGVPDSRVAEPLALAHALTQASPGESAAFVAMEARRRASSAVDREALARAVEERSAHVALTYGAELGTVDLWIAARPPSGGCLASPIAETSDGWERFISEPTRALRTRRLRSALRTYLRERLPEHMVPSAIVVLDRLPLNPNGKVDRAALPIPDARAGTSPVARTPPRDAVEHTLARIWSRVLGIGDVGVHESFFDLGGDSIVAMRMVAQAKAAGVTITPRQVFQGPTIAELARAVAAPAEPAAAPAGPSPGPVPFMPVERWFLQAGWPNPAHFNVSMLLEVSGDVKPDVLERAIRSVLSRHDAFQMRITRSGGGWQKELVAADQGNVMRWERLAVPEVEASEQRAFIAARCDELQRGFDLARGPLACAAWFDRGPGRAPRLFLAAHHFCVDTVSLGVVADEVGAAYARMASGAAPTPPPATTPTSTWARRLAAEAVSDRTEAELAWWLGQPWSHAGRVPSDAPAGAPAGLGEVQQTLGEELGRRIDAAARAKRAGVYDILLAAFVATMAEWTGKQSVLLDIERHGRDPIFDDVDLSRSVGWFTTVYPLVVQLGDAREPGEILRRVSAAVSSVPRGGLGYAMLRWLRDDPKAEQLAALPEPELLFNYLGRSSAAPATASLMRIVQEPCGDPFDRGAPRTKVLDVHAAMFDDVVRVRWAYSTDRCRRETIERLTESFHQRILWLTTDG